MRDTPVKAHVTTVKWQHPCVPAHLQYEARYVAIISIRYSVKKHLCNIFIFNFSRKFGLVVLVKYCTANVKVEMLMIPLLWPSAKIAELLDTFQGQFQHLAPFF